MCGIASLISSDPSRLALVEGMVQHQASRGPDHGAVWVDGPAALGHNRLALLELSAAGDQPMHCGPLSITYNGEIYNHRELRHAYLQGRTFAGDSDTETLLHLIAVLGVKRTLPLLRGMYAFAVWHDGDKTLTMAVDPFAVKPLYWWHGRFEFACASSSAALLSLQPHWNISADGMARFFRLGGSDGVWHGIQRMHGGHMATYEHHTGRFTQERWYYPKHNPNAAEEIEGLVHHAMNQVQYADVPLGIFLSGGVDSSVAASYCGPGAIAFHLDSPEREHAATVAAHFGVPMEVVPCDPTVVVAAYKDIAERTGEPTMGGHIPWLVSRHAATKVKAAISANGADELFFGYDRIPATDNAKGHEAQLRHMMRDPAAYTMDCGIGIFRVPQLVPQTDTAAHARWVELMLYVQHDLNPTLDAASMCHSLEMRVPFLDHVLVEAALSLPASFHGNKRVLREMLAQASIPDATINRPKVGFSMDRQDPALQHAIERAVRTMARTHGFVIHPNASPRDRAYLRLCALAWCTWEDTWRHRLANTNPV